MFPPSLSSIIESAGRHGRQWELEYNGMRLSAMGQDDTDNLVRSLPAMEKTLGRLARQAAHHAPAVTVMPVQPVPAAPAPNPEPVPVALPPVAEPAASTPAAVEVNVSTPAVADAPPKVPAGEAPPATDLVSLAAWHLRQYKRRASASKHTPSIVNRTLQLFIASVGNKDIKVLTFQDMEQFMEDLAIWPKNAERVPGYKRTGIAGVLGKIREDARKREEAAEARAAKGKKGKTTKTPAPPKLPVISKCTQETQLQHLSAFFNHALEWRLRPDNPVLSINRRREFGPRFTHPKRAFTNPEWRLPFRADILNAVTEPHKFFGLLLLGFTGARPNEVAQLKRHDVRMESVLGQDGVMHEVLCMHIGATAAQHTKNEDARRVLPIPNQVLAMGFETYLNDLDRHGATELFPGLQEAEARPGASISRYLNTALRKWGVSDRSVTTYCFRHFVATLASKCRVPELVQDALFGHSSAVMTEGQRTRKRSYVNPTTPLTMLEALDSLPFPEIDAKSYESGRFDQNLSYEVARLKHNDEREARGEERVSRRGRVPRRGPFKPKVAKPATSNAKAATKGKTPKAKAPERERTEGTSPAQGGGLA